MNHRSSLGGTREGAGRPATLREPTRRNITFETKQLLKLKRYAKRHKLNGQSAAVRKLIDDHA